MSLGYNERDLHPEPRPITHRGWMILGVVAVAVLAVLGGIVYFYAAEGKSTINGGLQSSDTPGLIVTIEPRSVVTSTEQAVVHMSLDTASSGIIGDDGRMKANTRLLVLTSLGAQEVKFLAGDTIGQFDAPVGLDGEAANYPFDSHAGFVVVVADTYMVGSDGTVVTVENVPVGLRGAGSVNGWNTTMDIEPTVSESPMAVLTFDRAFSTQMFAILLLALSVVIALMSVVIGVLVMTNRRRLEATMLSWGAALLFALPLLRNHLPNAPPVGSSIDIYVYLWVIVGAVAGLLMLVTSWARQQRADLIAKKAEREARE